MLKLKRIDYFHRGLIEIWGEYQAHKDTLNIADKIMLYYPLPVYFFVSRHKPSLAKKIHQGLQLALEDGSFEALFKAEIGPYSEKGKLGSRRLISLINPDLPPDTPHIDTSWWLPEKFQQIIH